VSVVDQLQGMVFGVAISGIPALYYYSKLKRFNVINHPGDVIVWMGDPLKNIFPIHVHDVGKGDGVAVPGVGFLRFDYKRIWHCRALGVRMAFAYLKQHTVFDLQVMSTANKIKKKGILHREDAEAKIEKMVAEAMAKVAPQKPTSPDTPKEEEKKKPTEEEIEMLDLADFLDYIKSCAPEEVDRFVQIAKDEELGYVESQGKKPKSRRGLIIVLVLMLLVAVFVFREYIPGLH
jgi:hypothetical protein